MTASITLRVDYLIVLFLCFFSPLEFSIEIISGKYFTVSKTACFEPLSEVAVLHHRAAVKHFKTRALRRRIVVCLRIVASARHTPCFGRYRCEKMIPNHFFLLTRYDHLGLLLQTLEQHMALTDEEAALVAGR